jgi:hypothetical protein
MDSITRPKSSKEALKIWERIARGETDQTTEAWIRHVARRLVEDVFAGKFYPASRRADKALEVIGWRGRVGKYPGLAELVQLADAKGFSARDIVNAAPLIIDVPKDPRKLKKAVEYIRSKASKK